MKGNRIGTSVKLEAIQGTGYGIDILGHNMGIDLGSFHVGVAQQILHHADINAVFEKMGSKRMAKSVTADPFVDLGTSHGSLHRLL